MCGFSPQQTMESFNFDVMISCWLGCILFNQLEMHDEGPSFGSTGCPHLYSFVPHDAIPPRRRPSSLTDTADFEVYPFQLAEIL